MDAKQRARIGQAKVVKRAHIPPYSLYWGAWIGSQLTGTAAPYDMSAVHEFEDNVDKPLSLVEFAVPLADCKVSPCTYFNFPTNQMQDIRDYGAIPFLSWSTAALINNPDPTQQPDFQLSDILAGRYDSQIRNFATQAKNWGKPYFLRFNWEMNSNWFPWGVDVNGNNPEQYVPAWRHVHDIFSSVGANNATWVWCPYVDIDRRQNLRQLYPGDAYVDWTCLDGYNWGPGSPANPRPWRTFREIYDGTYRRVAKSWGIAPSKPMILAEMASSDYGGDKAAWIRNTLGLVRTRYPKVHGLIWFDVNDRNAGWMLETNPAAVSAFRDGIQPQAYLPNQYGGIGTSPIPVPPAP